MLTPGEVIEASEIVAHPGAFVIGCYDSRITLYSQQVRALQLAHALEAEHYLANGKRVAVIGGGAAGMTIAAALALRKGITVHLFEADVNLMPLQGATERRRLDAHIYNWPALGSNQPQADLPILDWKSGTARAVRNDLLADFQEIVTRTGDRVRLHLRHEVTAVEPREQFFDIAATHRLEDGTGVNMTQTVDYVILAIGFGREAVQPIPNTVTESYWTDAGVPGAGVGGLPHQRFFISGNGDGALIDFVAAASANFSHHTLIEAITRYPDIGSISDELLAIDTEARLADTNGEEFDFVGAYDDRIGESVEALGLVNEIDGLLRPGVQLVLQTRDQQPMMVRTAILNRLAAYLVIRACRRPNGRSFRHVVAPVVTPLPVPPAPNAPAYILQCGAEQIDADKVIVRWGPGRDLVRAPFAQLLLGHGDAHDAWLAQRPPENIIPSLSQDAHERFARLAKEVALPPPRYRFAELAALLPQRVKLVRHQELVRWQGEIAIDAATGVWSPGPQTLHLYCDSTPSQIGPLAAALARLAIHSDHAILVVDPARWRTMLNNLTTNSLHADAMAAPRIEALDGVPPMHNVSDLSADAMAGQLNGAMDQWVLGAIDAHLGAYLARGEDAGSIVQMRAADDLRAAMEAIWATWRALFTANPALLSRFLRLAICARDDAATAAEAQVLCGPRKLKSLVRATAAALAIATAWQATEPSEAEPGNLAQNLGEGARFGHTCAASMIDGTVTALAAARYMWRTHFVVLPMEHSSIRTVFAAEQPLNAREDVIPTLQEADEPAAVILTLDERFMAAAEGGLASIADLLAETEAGHFRDLRLAIEPEPGENP